MSKYKIKGEFVYSDKYSQLTENLDAAINEIASDNKRNDSAHSVDQIKKYENGTYKKYIVHDNKVYDDNDTLDYNEKKERILNDLKNDVIPKTVSISATTNNPQPHPIKFSAGATSFL